MLVDSGKRVNFYSNIDFKENTFRWKVTTSADIYSVSKSDMTMDKWFSKLLFNNRSNYPDIISNGIISYLINGIELSSKDIVFSDIVFSYGYNALTVNKEGIVVKNTLSRNFRSLTHNIYIKFTVNNNIMLYNDDDLVTMNAEVQIFNNYYISNRVALRPVRGNVHIHNNEFSRNDYGISTVASSPLIEHNNFHGSERFCIQTQKIYVHQYFNYSNPLVNRNNLFSTTNIIISMNADNVDQSYVGGGIGVRNNIDATMNYWELSEPSEFIWDIHNQHLFPDTECDYEVIISPKSITMINNAGIIK